LYALLRRWLLSIIFLAAYWLLLLLWTFSFVRLVRPIIPLLFVVLLAGVSTAVGAVAPRYRRLAVYVMAAVLAAGAIALTGPELNDRLACDRSAPADSETCWPVSERELLSLANWVRDSTPADAVFLVSKERAFYFHSGRKSINQDRGLREDSASFGPYLRMRGVSYTVLTPVGVRADRHAGLIESACRDFELVKQVSRRTLLLRVVPQAAASDSTPTCAAIREFDSP